MANRPEAYNTITPQLRDELGAALDEAQHDPAVRVVLLDAEGRAFCAGYGLDWSTAAQAADHMYDPASSRRLGTLFDGMARHSQEGADFVARSQEVGFREAVRERDRPFGDYGERPRD